MKKLILCDKDTKENNYNYECPKLNNDDWDELSDPCVVCGAIEGYDQAMQDFMKKAEGFLTERVVLCFRVSWTEQQTPFLDFNIKNIVEQFKNYMQNEM